MPRVINVPHYSRVSPPKFPRKQLLMTIGMAVRKRAILRSMLALLALMLFAEKGFIQEVIHIADPE